MKILVASDGSENSAHAVKYAAKLASTLTPPASLTLISVHDDAALRHASHFVGKQQVDDYLKDQSEKELQSARQALDAAGIRYEQAILTGHVSEQIVKYAADNGFDMIVLGAKGRSGLTDLLVGSVAQRVLSTATQAVLLVK